MLLTEAGHYQAKLTPINAHLAGDVTGEALVKVKNDKFYVEVKVNGAPAQIIHAQKIHVANECPTLSSDINKDGIIDAVEGRKDYGPVIIPLDYELKTQIEKEVKFPQADFSGNYFYRQDARLTEMMKDLSQKDMDQSDDVIKLKSTLGLAGRQIVIYGVPAETALPETVATINGQSKHASLPIACGSFVKIAVDEEGSTSGGVKD